MSLPHAKLLIGMYGLPDTEAEAIAVSITKQHIAALNNALQNLYKYRDGSRRRSVIMQYYGIGCERKSLASIGSNLPSPVGRERVRVIRNQALHILRRQALIRPVVEHLSEHGYSGTWMKLTPDRLATEQPKALQNISAVPPVRGTFLLTCWVSCTPQLPCPTCRAKTVLEQAGLLSEVKSLAELWLEGSGDDWRAIAISALGFSARTRNGLINAHIETLGQLAEVTEKELRRIPNIGRKSFHEIRVRLGEFNLRLRE